MTPRRSISGKERARLFALHGGVCHICRGKIHGATEAWEVEHVIALAISGDDSDANRLLAHVKCHRAKTARDAALIAKAKRTEAKHLGIKPRSSRPLPGSKASGIRRRMDGTVERRT